MVDPICAINMLAGAEFQAQEERTTHAAYNDHGEVKGKGRREAKMYVDRYTCGVSKHRYSRCYDVSSA